MPEAGESVGPYVLGPELGRGASGIVYQAVDPRLGRKAALKVLDEEARGPNFPRERFEREARLLAAVDHPNVARVYGVVEQAGQLWLALEYLEGESLAEILARGALPIEDALDVARQVADGLEAAHERGVIHRDLKPANLMRLPDGTVKVVDFGLARQERDAADPAPSTSSEGLVLGTPLYMSPEQLRGRKVDRRTDVWAFGCVLWELLTAERAFGGETSADLLHAILETDPDPARLPPRTPGRIRNLLERCFRKEARQRLRDVGDARLELEAALTERAWSRPENEAPGVAGGRKAWPWVGLVLLGLLGFVVGRLWGAEPGSTVEEVRRVALDVPAGQKISYPRLSPDGQVLVHEVHPEGDRTRRHLVYRRLDSFEDVPIVGTEGIETLAFSADSRDLAVVCASEGASRYDLSIVSLNSSRPKRFLLTLPPHLNTSGSIAWLEDGRLVLSVRPRSLLLVGPDGETEERPVVCDESLWPHAPDVLGSWPGTRQILASAFRLSERGAFESIVAIDVDTGLQNELVQNSGTAVWHPPGHLLFSRADVLLSVGLDAKEIATVGEAEPIESGLSMEQAWRSGTFHASRQGSVVWWPGDDSVRELQLSWLDAENPPRLWSGDRWALEGFLNVDPSGSYLTCVVVGAGGNYQLWGADLGGADLRQLLADDRRDFMGGAASIDDRRLYFCRFGPEGAQLMRTSLDRPVELQELYADGTEGTTMMDPQLVDRGRLLMVYRRNTSHRALLSFDLSQEPPWVPKVVYEGHLETRIRPSPDGRWLLLQEGAQEPFLVTVLPDGELGRSYPVPTGGRSLTAGIWAPDAESSHPAFYLMGGSSTSTHKVEFEVGAEGPVFQEPEVVHELVGQRFYDAAYVSKGRFLAVLIDADVNARDRIHLRTGLRLSEPRR